MFLIKKPISINQAAPHLLVGYTSRCIWHLRIERKLVSDSCLLQVSESIINPNGRYIILWATCRGIALILCNLYVPNTSQISFLQSLLSKLFQMSPSAFIIGGDFTVAFSETADELLLKGEDTLALPSKNSLGLSVGSVENFRYFIFDG